MKLKQIFSILLFSIFPLLSYSQNDNNSLFSDENKPKFLHYKSITDLSLSVGPSFFIGKYDYFKEGINVAFDYGTFNRRGLGFRYGASFSQYYNQEVNLFMLPVKFGWRTPVSAYYNVDERVDSYYDTYYYSDDYAWESFKNGGFFSLLANLLFYRVEFNVGLTPGYVYDYAAERGKLSGGKTYYESGVYINNKLFLTADVGFRYSMRIWRILPFFQVTYSYLLTKPFKHVNNKGVTNGVNNGFVNVNFGLTFLL